MGGVRGPETGLAGRRPRSRGPETGMAGRRPKSQASKTSGRIRRQF